MIFSSLDKFLILVRVLLADPSRRGKHLGMWLRSAQDGRANAGQEAVRRGFLTTRPVLADGFCECSPARSGASHRNFTALRITFLS